MDDFDRLRAIRRSNLDGEGYGQNYERPDLDELKEKEPPLVDPIMIKAAVCGFLIYFLIFFVLIHPLEKIQYKMAYYGSYCITISTGSSTQRMYVDGKVQASFGFTATVKITIDQFGMVDLTLPEVV